MLGEERNYEKTAVLSGRRLEGRDTWAISCYDFLYPHKSHIGTPTFTLQNAFNTEENEVIKSTVDLPHGGIHFKMSSMIAPKWGVFV